MRLANGYEDPTRATKPPRKHRPNLHQFLANYNQIRTRDSRYIICPPTLETAIRSAGISVWGIHLPQIEMLGHRHRHRTSADSKLGKDILDMEFDRRLRQAKIPSDFLIALSLLEQQQCLLLAGA